VWPSSKRMMVWAPAPVVKVPMFKLAQRVLYQEVAEREGALALTLEGEIVKIEDAEAGVISIQLATPSGVRVVSGVPLGGPGQPQTWWLPETGA